MFGSVVLEIPKATFEHEFEAVEDAPRAPRSTPTSTRPRCATSSSAYKSVVKEADEASRSRRIRTTSCAMARNAVFRSWNNARAKEYRRIYDIPDSIGTAVNVQMMVFGNTGDRSGTGVGFTRNPATGAKEFFGEFLINAQGEDVVAGIRTPQPIGELAKVMPKAYKQLREITTRLERHYKDIQDFEFTIQDETLYMLQTRSGKRTGYAAVVIATDFVKEKLITPKEAMLLVDPEALSQLLAPGFDSEGMEAHSRPRRKGLPASPGAACGQVVFSSENAVEWSNQGKPVILVRRETVPDDIHGMWVSQGILTATGGMTSHAAVVGRQMGKPSIVGAGELAHRRARQDVHRQGADRQGRRLRRVRRPHRRGEARQGGVAAERDPPGGRRQDEAGEVGHLSALQHAARPGPTSSAASACAPTPTSPTRRSSPTRSAPAASACAAPSTCSSARAASRSCSG